MSYELSAMSSFCLLTSTICHLSFVICLLTSAICLLSSDICHLLLQITHRQRPVAAVLGFAHGVGVDIVEIEYARGRRALIFL